MSVYSRAVLSTFTNKDNGIILVVAPKNGGADTAVLDAAMKEKWNDRYISLLALPGSSPDSLESQTAIAQAVFDKMVELGYLKN